MLLGLVRPTAGRALVMGYDVQRQPVAALHSVGAMVEAPAFYPYLSGRDNLRVLARAGGLDEGRVGHALDLVELAGRARDRLKATLRGCASAWRSPQRCSTSRNWLSSTNQPTGGDPAGQQEIRELIRTLVRSGRTISGFPPICFTRSSSCASVLAILKEGRADRGGRGGRTAAARAGCAGPRRRRPSVAIALLRETGWIDRVELRGDALLVDAPVERAAEINALLAAHAIAVAEFRGHRAAARRLFPRSDTNRGCGTWRIGG